MAVGLCKTWPDHRHPLKIPTAFVELVPSVGQGVRQSIGPVFELMHRFLGDQWSIGDWNGLGEAMQESLPPPLQMVASAFAHGEVPPQNLKEYDPEWAGVLDGDRLAWGARMIRMLTAVKGPVLFTHHFRMVDEQSGYFWVAHLRSAGRTGGERDLVDCSRPPLRVRVVTVDGLIHSAVGRVQFVNTLTSWDQSLSTYRLCELVCAPTTHGSSRTGISSNRGHTPLAAPPMAVQGRATLACTAGPDCPSQKGT